MLSQAELAQFVKQAFGEQKRLYTFEPAWTHSLAVANILAFAECSIHEQAAGLGHDLFEDCSDFLVKHGYTTSKLKYMFGSEALQMMLELTEAKAVAGMSRKERKESYLKQVLLGSDGTKRVKLADTLHNIPSIVAHANTSFARRYVQEKLEFVTQVDSGVHRELWKRVHTLLIESQKTLGAL